MSDDYPRPALGSMYSAEDVRTAREEAAAAQRESDAVEAFNQIIYHYEHASEAAALGRKVMQAILESPLFKGIIPQK